MNSLSIINNESMCFSASASFGASVILGTIGVVTRRKTTDRTQVPFAAIPLMFAAQQFSEGMLWMGLSDPAYASWQHFPVDILLIFAQLIWPSWIPFFSFTARGESGA